MLVAVSFCHLMNDTMQSLLPSIYPILKTAFHLNFGQIGLLTLTFQMTASILQPFIGHLPQTDAVFPADRHALHPGRTAIAVDCAYLPVAAAGRVLDWHGLGGLSSGVFPSGTSCLRWTAWGWRSRSFRLGETPDRRSDHCWQHSLCCPTASEEWTFSLVAMVAIVAPTRVSRWYKPRSGYLRKRSTTHADTGLSRGRVVSAITVLIALVFSKYFYLASFTSYYTFYLMTRLTSA